MSFFSKFFGDANKKTVGGYEETVRKINELEPMFERFSLEELWAKTAEFKKLIAENGKLDTVLAEAFAAVREAAKRTLGQRHFDVQLMGGIALHEGKIAEMKTGEGKTLAATAAVYLNALEGRGAHVITVNDYLSRRDTVWMGQIYHTLGLTTGCINHEASYVYDPLHKEETSDLSAEQAGKEQGTSEKEKELDKTRDAQGSFRVIHEFLRPVSRREAYEADITYGTNNEFGFDYLRDNMTYDRSQMAQAKGHNFAVVDEVDSILIDEARTPLIISAPDVDSTKLYETFAKIVPRLKENEDYNVDEKLKAISITENGIGRVERILNLKNIYEEGGTRYVHHLEQALKAHILFFKDRDYVVKNDEIVIVDEFTGRLMPGRRWSEGLHQAIEAKEGVYVQKESRTLATITFQNYFRLYKKLAGMTGTAQTSAEEFHKVYNLGVVTIPTNKPMIRGDLSDRIYKTEAGKFGALVKEIKEKHLCGQPVLVGTVSITKNELLSSHLEREGIPHQVLNAKNHEREGEIIAQAGKIGAVTVATNMAGRGVDIMFGGNPPDQEQAQRVRDLGGLHVIGTERHEARRIDNQLRGRAGRQGDPGSSQFFVSMEDDLVRIFGGDRLKNIMDRLGVGEEEAIENSLISKAIEQAQSKIEGHNFDMRKYVLEYDDVMNRHRTAIYKLRREILESEDNKERILGYIKRIISKIISFHAAGPNYQWNVEEIAEIFKSLTGIEEGVREKLSELSSNQSSQPIADYLTSLAIAVHEKREKEIGAAAMRNLEKMLLLRVIDELWVDHLEQMEYLRDSVRLRAYGQRDPLVEYKVEGQKMFNQLQETVAEQVAGLIFKVSAMNRPKEGEMEKGRANMQHAAGEASKAAVQEEKETKGRRSEVISGQKTGRNDPCPCGSGKKFKKCHGS